MSDEQQNEQQEQQVQEPEEQKQASKCEKKNVVISCILYVLVIISLIFSIVASSLSIINMVNAKGEEPAPARERTADRKKVVISTQYDKGQSLKKAYKTHKPVVVFFYTDWCGFCQRFAPTFYKVTTDREIKSKFAIAYVNCEESENKEYMKDFGVRGFPTVYVIAKDGSRTHLENSTFFNDDSVKVVKENMLKAIE